MKKLLTIWLTSFSLSVFAQNFTEKTINIPIEKDSIYGTLLAPNKITNIPLVIIIAGSGPTDRDGNSIMSHNNSLKFLAEGLSNKGIATYRYDKRIVSMMKKKTSIDEESISFDDFITDAKTVIHYFKNQNKYNKLYVIGHSQGSLVGMIAAKNNVSGFISIAGAGNSIDVILKEQLSKQIPQLKESYTNTLNKLKNGEKDVNFNPMLQSIFRLSIQPFLISWIQYNPQTEIAKLNIPILIIQGTKDLQVSVDEAKLLKTAKASARLELINNMNHVLKNIEGNSNDNYASYNNAVLLIHPKVVDVIEDFIKKK